jgi:hypothetical protein
MRSSTSRSRTIAVTALALGLLVAGPAAYAAGAASADRSDRPANVASGPSDSTGSSGGSGSSGSSEGSSGSGSSSGGGEHDHAGHTGPGSSGSGDGSGDSAGAGAGAGGGSADQGSGSAGDEPDAGDGEKKGAPSALDILAVDCSGSRLTAHDGFQKAPRCVSTAFGEVADADRSPSLLITQAPTTVRPGESFRLTVSTRNLVRDRFLPAAQGGYAEASLLDGQGLQRGHFHTACRILPDPGEAPDSSPDPLFFQATEDGGGGARPDSVTIDVPGVEQTGELQCSSWAGDGSHRTPMMQRANQTPAFDSVRIEVG